MRAPGVVESFTALGSRVMGIIGLVMAGLVIADAAFAGRIGSGVTVVVVALLFAVVFWIGLVRPSVRAYERELVLRNFVRDVHIPWHLVTAAELRPMVTIELTDGERHQAIALGATRRDRRAQRQGDPMNPTDSAALHHAARSGEDTTPKAPSTNPARHACQRLRTLARDYAETSREGDEQTVTKRWAVPELAALGITVLATLVVGVVL